MKTTLKNSTVKVKGRKKVSDEEFWAEMYKAGKSVSIMEIAKQVQENRLKKAKGKTK